MWALFSRYPQPIGLGPVPFGVLSMRNLDQPSPSSEINITVTSVANGGRRDRYAVPVGTTVGAIARDLNISQSDHVARINSANVAWDAPATADCQISFTPLKTPGA